MHVVMPILFALAAVVVALLFADRRVLLRRLARATSIGTVAPAGLLDFDSFDDALTRELARAELLNAPLAVAYVEVCGISEIRAMQGQRSASDVCTAIGTALASMRVGSEIVARIATDTFGVIVPDTDSETAGLRLSEIHAALCASISNVRLSIGAAMSEGFAASDVEQAAERSLFAAHELGSDRLVWYGEHVEQVLSQSNDRRQSTRVGQLATVLKLAETLDLRDADTSEHSHNVSRYCEVMARGLGMPLAEVERIRIAGLLHDIGKIGIADSVLRKPAKLDDNEWAQMKEHPEIGSRILDGLGADDIRGWVLAHHERPDGRGYPFGLKDVEIPLAAKILAVADSYEAMTADRVYRKAPGPEFARSELIKWCGAQFDADVVEVFLRELDAIELAERQQVAQLVVADTNSGAADKPLDDLGMAA